MTIPVARALPFPGVDVEALARLRVSACDAFVRNDLTTYRDACMMIRELIGGQDVLAPTSRVFAVAKKVRGGPQCSGKKCGAG